MKLRLLFLGRKVMTNLDSIFKSRDITLPTKVHLVKAMVFPVVMHGCECWTVKKAEHRRIDAFELWCWRTLESALDCKEIQPVHSEGDQPWDFFGRNDAKAENSSTLTTSCEELTHWKRPWCWERLKVGGEGDDRGWDGLSVEFEWTLGVGDTIQPSHPLPSPLPSAPNPSQHQSLFQWVNSSHEVTKVLEFQL